MKTLFLSIIFYSFFGLNITAQKNTKLRAPEYNQIILFNNGTIQIDMSTDDTRGKTFLESTEIKKVREQKDLKLGEKLVASYYR